MPACPYRLHLWITCALGLLLAAPAQAQGSNPGIYRCGSSYGAMPCPGGQAVAADDGRSADQRQQAQAAQQQQARLADQLADERRAREQAAVGRQAARIGPSAAERAQTDAAQAKAQTKAQTKAAAERKRAVRPSVRKAPRRHQLGAA